MPKRYSPKLSSKFKCTFILYRKFISKVSKRDKGRFSELQNSPIFTNLPIILDWEWRPQTNDLLINFGDDEIGALTAHLLLLLGKIFLKQEA